MPDLLKYLRASSILDSSCWSMYSCQPYSSLFIVLTVLIFRLLYWLKYSVIVSYKQSTCSDRGLYIITMFLHCTFATLFPPRWVSPKFAEIDKMFPGFWFNFFSISL